MYAKDELEKMQKLEDEYKAKLKELEQNSDNVLDAYYREFCGKDYEKIKNTIQELKDLFYSGEHSYRNLDEYLLKILKKGLNNIISKKTSLDVIYKRGYREGNLVIGSYGLGVERKGYWGTDRARKLESLEEILYAFGICPKDTYKKIWKESNKQLFKAFQKYLPKWKRLEPYDSNLKLDRYIIERDEETIYHLINKERNRINISLGDRWYSKISFGKYYSSDSIVDFRTQDGITDYQCFLLYQIWDKVGLKIIKLKNEVEMVQKNNKKILDDLVDEISHLLAVLDL